MDKRSDARYPLDLCGVYVADRGLPGHSCTLRNVSRQGFAIYSRPNGPMPAGQKLLFKIRHPGTGRMITSLAALKWKRDVARDPEHGFEAGLQFDDISQADKRALLEYAYTAWFRSSQAPGC